MKKTLLSVATVTALTGVASHNISAADYTVQEGDTLWGVANESGTTVSNLKEANGLSSNLILPDDVIEVDGETEEAPVEENDGTYVIESGDTLFEIGEKFGVDYNQIMEWNNLSSDLIFAGKTLIISETAAPAASAVEESPAVEETPQAEEETQESGTVQAAEVEETPQQTQEQSVSQAVETEEAPAVEETPQQAQEQNTSQTVEAEEAPTVEEAPQQTQEQNVSQAVETEESPTVEETPQQAQEQSVSQTVEAEEAPAVEENPQAPSPSDQPISYGANHYTNGDCTWYVFERRKEMGQSVSNSWGDASNWAGAATSEGMSVNNSPSVGAIMQTSPGQNGASGQGHVAIVENVNSDGSIQVSEMNWNGGMGVQSTRTISATEAAQHNFIH